ncbi:hypothetical protein SLA2020_124710 [Shorea laevis]
MHHILLGFLLLSLGSLTSLVFSSTDSQDVSALNVMFKYLNYPSQLSGWKANGGDPCGDSWEGIGCSGSSVTEIKLSNYGLSGQLGYELSNMKSVQSFVLSKNSLSGEIPYQLPPNTIHIDLSNNGFTGTVPYSISQMTGLQDLDVSHNQLNGELSDMFGSLSKLNSMDLSFNQLKGNLPLSFTNLTSLTSLHLEKNKLTGSINVLRALPLNELNVENNRFTGWIPDELKDINNLQTGGNSWSTVPAPPPPPGVHHHSHNEDEQKSAEGGLKSAVSVVIIGATCLGVLLVVALLIALISRRKSSPSSHFLDEEMGDQRKGLTSGKSQELPTELYKGISEDEKDHKQVDSTASTAIKSLQRAPSMGLKTSPSGRVSFSDNEFASHLIVSRSTSIRAVHYSLADLQSATANFATGRLLGVGSIGRVYRAKYEDGKVLAVKKIDSSLFNGRRPDEFSDIVASISKFNHPNMAGLVGYCSEQGQNMLIYEYYRNGSLHEFLHKSHDFSKPLTWNTRVRIALGTARAIAYLHEVCSPPLIHKNIKSSNILLDAELNPHLSDYGLANFHERTSQNLGVGYNAPECTDPSAYTQKSDVYSFGVVMLELLTGRMPLDSNKPKSEQCLVRWATPQLHDIDALGRMVDPALCGLYPTKAVSRFADIIALCVQVEPGTRPPTSQVVRELLLLVQHTSMQMKEELLSSRRTEDSDY